VATILDAARRTARDVHGVCLFQYSTGCRIGEALAMRWSAVDLEQARVTIRLRIHAGEVGPVKTANSLRTIPISQELVDYLRARPQRSEWVFASPSNRKRHWRDEDVRARIAQIREPADGECSESHRPRFRGPLESPAIGSSRGDLSVYALSDVEKTRLSHLSAEHVRMIEEAIAKLPPNANIEPDFDLDESPSL
jgi:hypothetical protein